MKLDELPESGITASQDLRAGTFLGSLEGKLYMRPRGEMDNKEVYAIAKDAVVDVSGEDSTLHHIQRSSLQEEQNVTVLAYRRPFGHALIVQTTQHVRAGTQLFLPQHSSRWDRSEASHPSTTPNPEGVGTDSSLWPGSGNTTACGDNDESSEESKESDVSEYRDVDDNASGSNIVDVRGLSGSDHGEDNTIIVDPWQKVESRGRKSEKLNTLHEVILTLGDKPFPKTDLEKVYKEETGLPAMQKVTILLRDLQCCTSEGNTSKKRWTHNSKNCADLSRYPLSILHYAISEKKTISILALAKLCDYSSSYTRKVLRRLPCCQHAKDTRPFYYFHEPEKCTFKTHGIAEDIREAVEHIEQKPRVQLFRWNKRADAIVLEHRPKDATYNQVREKLKSAFPMYDFKNVNVSRRWHELQGDSSRSRRSL